MKKRTKLFWKKYIKITVLNVVISVSVAFGGVAITDYIFGNKDESSPPKPPKFRTISEMRADSIQSVLFMLRPEKYDELRKLSEKLYKYSKSGATLRLSAKQNSGDDCVNGYFNDFTNLDAQIAWRNAGDVAIKNDTVYMSDRDTVAFRYNMGIAYTNVPQINIYYFKYDGKIKSLRTIADKINNMRLESVYHELRHVDNFQYIINVPIEQRTRMLHAANELFATIAGNLGDYAVMGGKSQNWNKSFRGKVNIRDVNYKLPKNSQPIIDSAIVAALDRLEGDPQYRKVFLSRNGFSYNVLLEKWYGEKTSCETNAVNQMQSAFKINGRRTDIFNLASAKVRERAEQFLQSRDDDMRLVIQAHDNGVKFKKPYEPPTFKFPTLILPNFLNPEKE